MGLADVLSRALEGLRLRLPRAHAVRLVLRRYRTTIVSSRYQVDVERLTALLRVSDALPPVVQDCIIDTGAYLTLFPEKTWKRFVDHVEWLDGNELNYQIGCAA